MFKLLVQYLNDFEIFGGAIRDLILNVEPNDIDINTSLSKFEEDKNKLASILNQLNIKYNIDYVTPQYQSDEITNTIKTFNKELNDIAKLTKEQGLDINNILTDQRFINAMIENEIRKHAIGVRFILVDNDNFHIDLLIDATSEFDLDVNTLYSSKDGDNIQIRSYRYEGQEFQELIANLKNKIAHVEDHITEERAQKFIDRGWKINTKSQI